MLTGNNSLLQKATEAKLETRGSAVEEQARLWEAEKVMYEKTGRTGKAPETVEEIVNRLVSEKLLTPDERDKILGNEDKGIEATGQVTIGSKTIVFGTAGGKTLVEMFKAAAAVSCPGGASCTDKENHLHIGDYVNYTPSNTSASITVGKDGIYNNGTKDTTKTEIGTGVVSGTDEYQTFTVDTTSTYKTTWRVLGLGKDKSGAENVMLISGSPIRKTSTGDTDPYLVLEGAESYVYCKKTLDSICNIYANTNLADEVRSITMEDINSALGVEVTYDETTGSPTKVYQTSTPETNIDQYNGVASYKYNPGDYAPENYLRTGTKVAGNDVHRTAYWYNMNSVTSANATAKSLIFDGTTDSSNYAKSYWVASPGIYANGGNASFGPGIVDYGSATCGGFFYSYGGIYALAYAVRPVVSLNSGVQYGENAGQLKIMTGSEEQPWSTSAGNGRSATQTLDTTKAIQ